jgi:hypothetical protein
MDGLTQVVVWLNAAANAAGTILLAPVAVLPGWLSATLAATVTGLLMLVVFKYTSNQRAVKAVRDDIKANLLALKLFKDSTAVAFRAQGGLLWGGLRLMLLAVVPVLVMTVPMLLVLGQLALWYESRPLKVGEEAVLAMKLSDGDGPLPEVRLEPTSAVEVLVGPVRVPSKREVCWKIRARTEGYHRLQFTVDGEPADKELAVGEGFMRVSTKRPGWHLLDALEHPAEQAFGPDAPVQSIEIDSPPERSSWTSGTTWWMVYWFAVAMIAALCFRPLLNVNL